MFKTGDVVKVLYNDSNGDWNKSQATTGIVQQIDGMTTRLQIVDPKYKVNYNTCWVYNSPLYKLLKED
jgi:hypothetical protein